MEKKYLELRFKSGGYITTNITGLAVHEPFIHFYCINDFCKYELNAMLDDISYYKLYDNEVDFVNTIPISF